MKSRIYFIIYSNNKEHVIQLSSAQVQKKYVCVSVHNKLHEMGENDLS